jgi:uncharacterized protein
MPERSINPSVYNRNKAAKYRLVGERCPHCDAKIFPPRDACPDCNGEAKTPYAFSGKGEVWTHTTIYEPPAGFDFLGPYTVAIVKLAEGPMVTAMLTDVDNNKVSIGMPVEMVTRKLREDGDSGLIIYSYKFRPVLQPAPPEDLSQLQLL